MEAHQPSFQTHKKNWKEYFLESLMLFLAVSLGFFAENIREDLSSKEREQMFMVAFVSDLASDTIAINKRLPTNHKRVLAIDSILAYYSTHPYDNKISGWLYKQMNRASWGSTYTRNTTTLDQLRNSGGQIIIRNKAISDSIAAFNYSWERSNYYYNTYLLYQDRLHTSLEKMVSSKNLLSYYVKHTAYSNYENFPDTLTVKINPEQLNEYLNFLSRQKWTTQQDDSSHVRIKLKTIKLIEMIKTAYHLKSEQTH